MVTYETPNIIMTTSQADTISDETTVLNLIDKESFNICMPSTETEEDDQSLTVVSTDILKSIPISKEILARLDDASFIVTLHDQDDPIEVIEAQIVRDATLFVLSGDTLE